MNKTWTRIVIVVVAAAAVAFWVFFDRQRAPEQQMDAALNAMPAWQVIKEQEPALHQRILDQMAVQYNTAVIVVTHDNRIFDFAGRIDHMEDGRIVKSESRTPATPEASA